MKSYRFRLKGVITVTIAIILIIVAISIGLSYLNATNTKITISIYPQDAKVFIDGKNENKNNSSLYLARGKHKISMFLAGYEYYEQEIDVTEYTTKITKNLPELLATKKDKDYLALKDERESADMYRAQYEKIKNTFPIIEYLPYNAGDGSFGIWYNLDENYTNMSLTINISEQASVSKVNIASSKLKELDKTQSYVKYNIDFKGFDNNLLESFSYSSAEDANQFLEKGFSSIDNIIIFPGKMEGDYYYTQIRQNFESTIDENDYIEYKTILKKKNNSWEVIGLSPILTVFNAPGVPEDILLTVNKTYFPYQ